MRRISILLAMMLGLTAVVRPARGQGVGGEEWDYKAVEQAIKGIRTYLWSQWRNGHWRERGREGVKTGSGYTPNYGGVTALCAYALLAAGESYQDEKMSRTLKWLAECEMHGTYARAMRANVWAALPRDGPYRKALAADTKWLVYSVDGRGAYNYYPGPKAKIVSEDPRTWAKGRFDNSNSQLAVLGVWAGVRSGMEVKVGYWRHVESHWKACQNDDGGWSYMKKGGASYGSMSVAGLATMFICFDAIYRDKFIRCRGNTDYAPLVKGLGWLDKNFRPDSNPGRPTRWYEYYLYGVERVGLASGYKYFGKQDWYKQGARALLRRRGYGDVVNAAFALLFLARGQNPVLFNKLKYPGTWNSRPRDLANLTRWITSTFEKPVNWQIIHLGVPVSEWHDAPILYISGATAPKFTDEQIDSLRTFVLQGGVIFSEAACNRTAFTLAMKKAYARMFPVYELTRLPQNHPIYTLHFKIRRRRSLSGISNGVRLLAIHSPAEVSLAWQMNSFSTQADVYELGANIYFFVSDKKTLRKRGTTLWPRKRTFTPAETLKVTRVKYSGNWDPEPLAWERFAILMGRRHRVKIELGPAVTFEKLDAAEHPVAIVSGTSALALNEKQRDRLAKYIAAGGTVVMEASGGSKAFADSAEALCKTLLPEARIGVVSSRHPLFRKVGPVIDRVHYRRALKLSVYDPKRLRLRGVEQKGRLAVILSPDDLVAGLVGYECWGLKGYEPGSAFALMRNILLYASGKTIAAGRAAGDPALPDVEW